MNIIRMINDNEDAHMHTISGIRTCGRACRDRNFNASSDSFVCILQIVVLFETLELI